MTDSITVYEKPTCSKCREVNKILTARGVDFKKVNYYIEPLTEAKLHELLKKMGISARDLLRTTESIYKELELSKKKNLGDDELVKLMAKHPDLIQRPIVERGSKAALGRPVENIEKLF